MADRGPKGEAANRQRNAGLGDRPVSCGSEHATARRSGWEVYSDAADEWLARAEHDRSHTVRALTIAPRMVLGLRRGEPEQAIANFDRGWKLADAVLAVPDRHMLTVLHAFARSHARGPHYRDRPALVGDGSVDYQGLKYLGQSWPEIAEFLNDHRQADERS